MLQECNIGGIYPYGLIEQRTIANLFGGSDTNLSQLKLTLARSSG